MLHVNCSYNIQLRRGRQQNQACHLSSAKYLKRGGLLYFNLNAPPHSLEARNWDVGGDLHII